MFGTAKDSDGKTYFTFLGESAGVARKNIEDVIGAINDLKQTQGGKASLNDSLGVWESFLLGNNNTDYNFTQSFKSDYAALAQYIDLITQQGKKPEEAFAKIQGSVKNTSAQFENFVK